MWVRALFLLSVFVLSSCTTQITSELVSQPTRPISRLYLSDDTPIFNRTQQSAFFNAAQEAFEQCGVTIEESAQAQKDLPIFAPGVVQEKVQKDALAVERFRISSFQPDAILFMNWVDKTTQYGALKGANLVATIVESGTRRKIWTAKIYFSQEDHGALHYLNTLDPEMDFGKLLVKKLSDDKVIFGCSH